MASSEKPRFQPWNEEEFQADVFVRGMTWLQRHLYRALLQAAFFHGTRPYLPNDDDVLWVLAGAESPEMWEANKVRVLKRFTPAAHDPNLLENKRVTADWYNWKDQHDEAVTTGSLGGQRSAEARRKAFGSAQPVRVLCAEGPSKAPFEGPSTDTEGSRRPSEAREVKLREENISETNKEARGGSFSQEKPSKPLGGDWKNIAIRHKRVFGTKASVNFKDKYFDACAKYSETVVLDFFDTWAPGSKDWVEANNVTHPLHLFFKKLPEEAQDAVELAEAEREETEKVTATKKREEAAIQASIARQVAENQKMWHNTPVRSEESIEDFLGGPDVRSDNTQPDAGSPAGESDSVGAGVREGAPADS